MNFTQIKQRTENELVVAIDEEWGYRAFLWFPGMTGTELEAWWTNLEDVETFWRTEPGTRTRLRRGWPGEFIDAEESDELYALWSSLFRGGPYRSNIDMNGDNDLQNPYTYLKRIDGAVFLHRGAFNRDPE